MSLPTIKTFFVDENKISLYWDASPKSDIRKWNLYGTPNVTVDFIPPNKGVVLNGGIYPQNAFLKVVENIDNRDTYLTPGAVNVEITRAELGIGPTDPYYFLITSVDKDNVESAMEVPNIHAVPWRDDVFQDEAGYPVNMVYKSFGVDLWPLIGWDIDRYIDVDSLLGRPAKQISVDAVGDNAWIRFNSISNDPISIRHSSPYPFELRRGELDIRKIYVHNPSTNDITLRIFLAA